MPRQPSDAITAKHLEFIQAVITRQASNSFLLKGWTVTVAGALYAFNSTHLNWRLAMLGLLVVAAFWWLDAYFLRQERLFRCLYDEVRSASSEIESFTMSTAGFRDRKKNSYSSCIFSMTLGVFYGIVEAVGIALLVASSYHAG